MTDHMNDLERAKSLGMTVEEFQTLVGHDPLDTHSEFIDAATHTPSDSHEYKGEDEKKKSKKKKKVDAGSPYSPHDELTDVTGIGDKTMVPSETDEDVQNKTSREIENHWNRPIETPADKALYYGFHIHSKDNAYGLHGHYPGSPLGGSHLHGPQNKIGYHTHRYNTQELTQFKFGRPGIMIQLDGPHTHQHNAPDGSHSHSEENFGPASDDRAKDILDRNIRTDKN